MVAKIVTGMVLLISLAGVFLWNEYKLALTTPVVIGQAQLIEIEKGDSFRKITKKLLKQNIAIKPKWFKLIAYKDVAGKSRQYSITFPEGWSFKQLLQEIQDNPYLEKTLGTMDFQSIMARLDSSYKHPEGLFFPDTYFFDKNTTDFSILKKAHDKMQLILQTEWENKEKDLPLENAYHALILASIIEKETGAAVERPQIAGVFTRRLRKGMLLQTDPTVIYGMGDSYKGNIRYKDLRRPTAYNTYVIKGLPPTPIAMPGREAINAALHPAKGKSLYFVAKGKGAGTHVFSATLREHNNAVNKYQRKR
jgi:UPF0755 protein